MSEEQKKDKERGVPEIQQEYQSSCMQAGHLRYQIFTLKNDLELVLQKLRDLNIEAASVKAREDNKQLAAVEAVPESVRS